MKIGNEKLNAIVYSIEQDARNKAKRVLPNFKFADRDARKVSEILSKIPKPLLRELHLSSAFTPIKDSLLRKRSVTRRIKYSRTLKNEVLFIAMSCKDEAELLRKIKKINPFH